MKSPKKSFSIKISKKLIWLLEEGNYYNENGIMVLASFSKAAIIQYVKEEMKGFKRKIKDMQKDEMYWENDNSNTWLKVEPVNQCALVSRLRIKRNL